MPGKPVSDAVASKLKALFGGVPPIPPVAQFLDAEIVDVDKGSATFAMTVSDSLHNHVHVVHGSLLASLAELAVGLAITTALDDGEAFTITGMQTNFLRPVTDGRVKAVATVTRRGRTISYVDAEVTDEATGKAVCRVMATCYHRRMTT